MQFDQSQLDYLRAKWTEDLKQLRKRAPVTMQSLDERLNIVSVLGKETVEGFIWSYFSAASDQDIHIHALEVAYMRAPDYSGDLTTRREQFARDNKISVRTVIRYEDSAIEQLVSFLIDHLQEEAETILGGRAVGIPHLEDAATAEFSTTENETLLLGDAPTTLEEAARQLSQKQKELEFAKLRVQGLEEQVNSLKDIARRLLD